MVANVECGGRGRGDPSSPPHFLADFGPLTNAEHPPEQAIHGTFANSVPRLTASVACSVPNYALKTAIRASCGQPIDLINQKQAFHAGGRPNLFFKRAMGAGFVILSNFVTACECAQESSKLLREREVNCFFWSSCARY